MDRYYVSLRGVWQIPQVTRCLPVPTISWANLQLAPLSLGIPSPKLSIWLKLAPGWIAYLWLLLSLTHTFWCTCSRLRRELLQYSKVEAADATPLPAIPAEIHFHIASHLTYHDFVAYFELLWCCYQLEPTRAVLKDVLARTENMDTTQFSDQNSLPCYGCLQLRKEYNFYTYHRS
jgi:hypothetical protein